jgi:hypothetical protein
MSAQRPRSFARVYDSKHNAQSRLRACQEIRTLPKAYAPVTRAMRSRLTSAMLNSAFQPNTLG